MAQPRCPMCAKTHFARTTDSSLKVVFIHCSACGAVVSAVPIKKTTTTGQGITAADDWWAAA